ncbi:MAG: DUF3343 domain-containing protein [Eubacteriales bacterium]|nr:DUF3343 domain-containing protein [Eubacteriales bacterium]
MREKEFRIIITFSTTTDAMAMESYCQTHGVAGRLIPVPSVISAGCGMCWSAPSSQREWVENAVKDARLRCEGVYEMLI